MLVRYMSLTRVIFFHDFPYFFTFILIFKSMKISVFVLDYWMEEHVILYH